MIEYTRMLTDSGKKKNSDSGKNTKKSGSGKKGEAQESTPAKVTVISTAANSAGPVGTAGKSAPLTGDKTPLEICLMLLVLSGLAGMLLMNARRRQRNDAAA